MITNQMRVKVTISNIADDRKIRDSRCLRNKRNAGELAGLLCGNYRYSHIDGNDKVHDVSSSNFQ